MKTQIQIAVSVIVLFNILQVECYNVKPKQINVKKNDTDVPADQTGRGGRFFGLLGIIGKTLKDKRQNLSLNFSVKSKVTLCK